MFEAKKSTPADLSQGEDAVGNLNSVVAVFVAVVRLTIENIVRASRLQLDGATSASAQSCLVRCHPISQSQRC